MFIVKKYEINQHSRLGGAQFWTEHNMNHIPNIMKQAESERPPIESLSQSPGFANPGLPSPPPKPQWPKVAPARSEG